MRGPVGATCAAGGRACLLPFGALYAALFERCTPRQRRLLGDLGHDFRPGDFFDAPEDQAALMSGTA
jgi:hypothetical protein